jgi:hypothetical protein
LPLRTTILLGEPSIYRAKLESTLPDANEAELDRGVIIVGRRKVRVISRGN